MKGDFSRQTFAPGRHYAGVRMQQGRVQLDADWNEQADLVLHRDETAARDLVGPTGAPYDGGAFALLPLTQGDPTGKFDFRLSRGRFYVNGILCECETDVRYLAQPDRPELPALANPTDPDPVNPLAPAAGAPAQGFYLVYLDAWRRHETALEAPHLREPALGGPDTATRLRNLWQVRTVFIGGTRPRPLTAVPEYDRRTAAPTGALAARARAEDGAAPCVVPLAAGYRGLENQLYRVEVHATGAPLGASTTANVTEVRGDRVKVQSGTWAVGSWVEVFAAAAGELPERSVLAYVLGTAAEGWVTLSHSLQEALAGRAGVRIRAVPDGTATWKWSRDNGIVVTGIRAIRPDTREVVVTELGADPMLDFHPGDWVEILDDRTELQGLPGQLAVVESRNDATSTLVLRGAVRPLDAGPSKVNARHHPRIRRWDGAAAVRADGFLPLEDGVEVRFGAAEGAAAGSLTYRTGDFWLIPARTATAEETSGTIEWPIRMAGEEKVPLSLLPHGIRHHYARLGVVQWNGTTATPVIDERPLFPAATRFTVLRHLSGDGQEAIPGQPLPRALQVGVFNGDRPVAGVRISFATADGGVVAATEAGLASATGSVTVETDAKGIAQVRWRLGPDAAKRSQAATATLLLEPGGTPSDQTVVFTGRHSHADQVAYDAGGGTLNDQGTVQKALDRLASLVTLHPLSGHAEEYVQGAAPRRLRVRVANARGPVTDGLLKVKFAIQGTPAPGSLKAGAATGASLEVPVDPSGNAEVEWTPDATVRNQEVEASLVLPSGRHAGSPSSFRFTASGESAALVPYSSACGAMNGVTTVQGALDRVTSLYTLTAVGGNGVVAAPGETVRLRAAVTSPCGGSPDGAYQVAFAVMGGGGKLTPVGGGAPADSVTAAVVNSHAECDLTVGPNATLNVVVANLFGPHKGSPAHAQFSVSVSTARRVAFDPTGLPVLAGKTTVHDAIAQLTLVRAENPSMFVQEVLLISTGGRLVNDTSVGVRTFATGVRVRLSEQPAANTITPDSCLLSLELPYPLSSSDRTLWGGGSLLGYQTILLEINAFVEGTFAEIRFPTAVQGFLTERLLPALSAANFALSVRARLLLKGSCIWAAADRNRYLSGGVFGTDGGAGTTALRLGTSEPRTPGDFETWFRLIPEPVVLPPPPPPPPPYSYRTVTTSIGGRLL